MIGNAESFRAFLKQLERAAPSPATVLLSGESGSGKGLAARWLHAAGPRRDKPLVSVSLSALSPTLIESELFGHESGAFTGAQGPRTGRFRQADGGTLVLDDVQTLPLIQQAKLLRTLQERQVEPLGAEVPVPIDVRLVVTAANDLKGAVERGEFREDLYYRLAVVTLRAPSLRERLEDLPLLAEKLMQTAAKRALVPLRSLSEAALQRLAEHSWPGNVRELENALERVLVLSPASSYMEGGPDSAASKGGGPLPVEPEEFHFLAESAMDARGELARSILAAGVHLQDLEAAIFEQALKESRGNASATARRLGLSRRAFEYRRARLSSASGSAETGAGDSPSAPSAKRSTGNSGEQQAKS